MNPLKLYPVCALEMTFLFNFEKNFNTTIQEEPYTTISFEDGQVLTLKPENLEFDYMMYIVIREIAEKAMKLASVEDAKI